MCHNLESSVPVVMPAPVIITVMMVTVSAVVRPACPVVKSSPASFAIVMPAELASAEALSPEVV